MPKFTKDIGGIGFAPGPTSGVVDKSTSQAIDVLGKVGTELYGSSVKTGLEQDIAGIGEEFIKTQNVAADAEKKRIQVLEEMHTKGKGKKLTSAELDRYKKELARLDRAVKGGMSASDALTRIQTKTKEAISRAPFYKKEIQKMLASSSFGSGSVVSSLESRIKADQDIVKEKRKAVIALYKKHDIDPRDPQADRLLAIRTADKRFMDSLTLLDKKDKRTANIVFNRFVTRELGSLASASRAVQKEYPDVTKMPEQKRIALISQLEQAKVRIPSMLSNLQARSGLSAIDPTVKEAHSNTVKNTIDQYIGYLKGDIPAKAIANSVQMAENQDLINLRKSQPRLATTITILKNAGDSMGPFIARAIKSDIGTDVNTYLDGIAKFSNQKTAKIKDVTHPGSMSYYFKQISDKQAAKEFADKDIDRFFRTAHMEYSAKDPDITSVNQVILPFVNGTIRNPDDYTHPSYKSMLSFVASPVFKDNIGKDTNRTKTLEAIEKSIISYTNGKLIRDFRNDFINKDMSSVIVSKGKFLKAGDFVIIDVGEGGNLIFSRKRTNLLKTINQKAEVDAHVDYLNKTYGNLSSLISQAHLNVIISKGGVKADKKLITSKIFSKFISSKEDVDKQKAISIPGIDQQGYRQMQGFIRGGSPAVEAVNPTKRWNKKTGKIEDVR